MAHAARRAQIVKATIAASLIVDRQGIEKGGVELAAHRALLDAPIEPVARLLFRLALPALPPAITAKRQAQLEAAARRLDHYAGRGEWIRFVCSTLASWQGGEPVGWSRSAMWVDGPPRSLGALALELRREANWRRHRVLARRRQRLRPLQAARRRQAIKEWRADRRAAERAYPGFGGWTVAKPSPPPEAPGA